MKTGKLLRNTLILLFTTIVVFMLYSVNVSAAAIIDSGYCGINYNNVTYTLTDDGVLTISGTGAMDDNISWGEN